MPELPCTLPPSERINRNYQPRRPGPRPKTCLDRCPQCGNEFREEEIETIINGHFLKVYHKCGFFIGEIIIYRRTL